MGSPEMILKGFSQAFAEAAERLRYACEDVRLYGDLSREFPACQSYHTSYRQAFSEMTEAKAAYDAAARRAADQYRRTQAAAEVTITVKRESLVSGDGHRYLGWTYSYTTPVDITWTSSDGSARPGPPAGEYVSYGQGLTDLRDMLRRKYGRGVKIVTTW